MFLDSDPKKLDMTSLGTLFRQHGRNTPNSVCMTFRKLELTVNKIDVHLFVYFDKFACNTKIGFERFMSIFVPLEVIAANVTFI